MKKIISLLVIVLTSVLFSAPTYINIGTGGTAGTYYPLGGAFAEIWNSKITDVNAVAESTGASVANVNMLQKGDLDVAIIQNDVAYYAENGVELFKEKIGAVKGMAILYPEPIQCITIDPSIKAVADLKGKSVAIGAIGSGTSLNALQILEAAGLTEKDVKILYLSFAEAVTAMRDGQADAAFQVAGIPTAAIVDLATQKDVRIVPVDGELSAKLKAKYSYYTDYKIPGGTYSTQKTDATSVTVQSMLVVNEKVSEELVYNMLKTIYESKERITAAHKVGALIIPETALQGMSITLHPGAKKYFDEKGIK
ncbi:MAG: TAXI family TRAP transporter solute-binding subunit [Fusobacteriaceae bacterium]|jgi:TRAP transporter TAXI family solute receptor|nr:TAXI family TRAP transporter solute-binding subunit [Fusobacteriaceae bacterium]